MESLNDAREGGLECADEFGKVWKLDGTGITSASASVQSNVVDLLIDRLEGSGYYLLDVEDSP